MEVIAIALLTVSAFLLIKLLLFHAYLCKEGLTTYEIIQRQRSRKVHHQDSPGHKKTKNLISLNRASEHDARSKEGMPAEDSKDDMINLNQSNMRLVKKQVGSFVETPTTEKMKEVLKTGFLSPGIPKEARTDHKKINSEANIQSEARRKSERPTYADTLAKNTKSLKLLASPNDNDITAEKEFLPQKPRGADTLEYSVSQHRVEESIPSYRANRDLEGELNQSVGPLNAKESSR